jgi:hypothetical protein
MVRGPAAQHPPEARNDMQLRTITRPPLQPQLRLCRSPLGHQGPPMPGRSITRDEARGKRPGRRGPGDLPEVGRTRHWPARLWAQPRLDCAARGLLQQAGGPLPRHHLEGGTTLDLVLVLPRAAGAAMALDAPRGPSRGHQGKAGRVLTPPHARPGLGLFFPAASASCATRCSAGAPRQ